MFFFAFCLPDKWLKWSLSIFPLHDEGPLPSTRLIFLNQGNISLLVLSNSSSLVRWAQLLMAHPRSPCVNQNLLKQEQVTLRKQRLWGLFIVIGLGNLDWSETISKIQSVPNKHKKKTQTELTNSGLGFQDFRGKSAWSAVPWFLWGHKGCTCHHYRFMVDLCVKWISSFGIILLCFISTFSLKGFCWSFYNLEFWGFGIEVCSGHPCLYVVSSLNLNIVIPLHHVLISSLCCFPLHFDCLPWLVSLVSS